MNLYISYGDKVWSANDKQIHADGGVCKLCILGRSKADYDAKNISVTIDFGGTPHERQEYLEMLREEVDGLIQANEKAKKELDETRNRENAYKSEMEALKEAQLKELEQMDAVKELKKQHEQEAAAIDEQLKRKYGVE